MVGVVIRRTPGEVIRFAERVQIADTNMDAAERLNSMRHTDAIPRRGMKQDIHQLTRRTDRYYIVEPRTLEFSCKGAYSPPAYL